MTSQASRSEAYAYPMVSIGTVLEVLDVSIFCPFFSIFVPLVFLGRGYPFSSAAVICALVYNILVFLYVTLTYSLPRLTAPSFSFPSSLLRTSHPVTDWSSQIVLITGGSSGIGALLAETLAIRGVSVVVLDIQRGSLGSGSRIAWYKCDVSQKKEVDAAAKRIREEVGDPTMLINNAGIVQGKKMLDLSEEDIKETFGVNVLSHFWIIKTFLPAMLASGKPGHIMTVASVLGLVGSARMTDYCSSKSALIQLHDALRFELSSLSYTSNPPPITLTLLLPAHISTTLFAGVRFPRSALFNFFCPSLEPHEVVKRMVERLGRDGGGWNGGGGCGTVCLPAYAWSAPLVRWIPGLRELGQRISNADHAMEHFKRHHRRTDTASTDNDI